MAEIVAVDRLLAVPDPRNYRFVVFCCSFKWELGCTPDHALALFVDRAMAERYGALMWPSTFEVVDIAAWKAQKVVSA